jgi:hypothetical protein
MPSCRIELLCWDVIGPIDHIGYEGVTLVGDDWGEAVAWGGTINFPGWNNKIATLNFPHSSELLESLGRSP